MAITIIPHGRDPFNDLATLTVEYGRGTFRTPMRVVNRHDLNAKNKIGADISLTRTSHSFIIEESINQYGVRSILTINGYLGIILNKIKKIVDRVPKALIFLYPSLTIDGLSELNSDVKIESFYRFFCDLANQLNLECILLPVINNVSVPLRMARSRGLQLVPVINLQEKNINILSDRFLEAKNAESTDVPIIAFKFYSFASANLGYNLIMDNLDDIHENGHATMFVDVERILPANTLNVSAPHYGPFFIADLVAERYTGSSPRPKSQPIKKQIRLFCKNDLVTPKFNDSLTISGKFDIDEESRLFSNDKELQNLFVRVVTNTAETKDWDLSRPMYLSRVHENIRSRPEFEELQQNIDSRSTADYLNDKPDMNKVVIEHLQLRKRRV